MDVGVLENNPDSGGQGKNTGEDPGVEMDSGAQVGTRVKQYGDPGGKQVGLV